MANKDIQLTLVVDGKPLDALIKSTDGLKEAMKRAVVEAQQLKPAVVAAAATTQVYESLKKSVSSLQGVFASYSQAYENSLVQNTKLATVMRERMEATDDEVKSVKAVIAAEKDLGVVGGAVQVSGAQQVATFITQASTLRTLVPAMNNLIAQQRGLNATQEDAVGIANLMGKAMQGQTSALRRVGITFSESEEKVLKYGTEAERAAMLARVITNNVGEMNAKLGQTDAGKMKHLQNAFGAIKVKIGEIVYATGPYLAAASQVAVLASSFGQLRTIAATSLASLNGFARTIYQTGRAAAASAAAVVSSTAATSVNTAATAANTAAYGALSASQVAATATNNVFAASATASTAAETADTAATAADTAATATLTAAKVTATAANNGFAAAMTQSTATTAASTVAQNIEAASIVRTTVMTRGLTAAKAAASAMATRLTAILSANVYLLAAAAVAALAYGIYKLATAESQAEKQQKALNEAVNEGNASAGAELQKLDALFAALRKATKGTEAYERAKRAIEEQYGGYIGKLETEKGKIQDLTKAYDDLRKMVIAAAKARAMQTYIDKQVNDSYGGDDDYIEKLRDFVKGTGKSHFIIGDRTLSQDEMLGRLIADARSGKIHKFSVDGVYAKYFNKYSDDPGYTQVVLKTAAQKLRENEVNRNKVVKDAEARFGMSYPDAVNATSTSAQISKDHKNKAYYEEEKRKLQDDLNNLSSDSAKDRADAARIRKRIQDIDKQLKFYDATPTKPTKTGRKSGKQNKKDDPAEILKQQLEDARALEDARRENADQERKFARDLQNNKTQARIDAMKDGAEKELAQNDLDFQKELQQIDEHEQQLLEARRDAAEKIWNATHRKEREKGYSFDRKSIGNEVITADEKAIFEAQRAAASEKKTRADDEALKRHSTPIKLEELSTIKALTEAIQYYEKKAEEQSGNELYGTQQVIAAHQRKLEQLQAGAELQKQLSEISEIKGLNQREMKIRIRAIGLEELQNRIKAIQKRLADNAAPIGTEQRRAMQEQIKTYTQWQRQAIDATAQVRTAWGGLSNIGNAIENVSDTLRGNANAWKKITAVINAFFQVQEGIKTVTEVMRTFGLVSQVNAALKQKETAANIVNTQTVLAEAVASSTASQVKAASDATAASAATAAAGAETFKAHAAIPFVGIGIAAGLVGLMAATLAALPKFADGGIAYGATLGIFGEYAGASNNPEVVAPLDKLRSLIEPKGGGIGGEVTFRIEGRNLVGLLNKEHRHRSRNY